MPVVRLNSLNDFAEWRGQARSLLLAVVPPDEVSWLEPGVAPDMFDVAEPTPAPVTGRAVGTVPPRFIALAETAICHRDPDRFGLLYRLLWRLQRDPKLLEVRSDPDVGKLDRRVSAVRRDAHKMTAFVRFRRLEAEGGERYLAWFEPEHFTLEREAPFFMRRFSAMHWGIITPYRSTFWDGEALRFGPAGNKADVPAEDAIEAVWKAYYAAIFNPARLKVGMMKSEMPVRYWRNLPEAELIPQLIRTAGTAEAKMIERMATEPSARHSRQVPRSAALAAEPVRLDTLEAARAAAESCRRCPLYEMATQTVFGEGTPKAEIMFVGEQPGDQEDLAGRPFVGPAGQIFDAALAAAGIERKSVYVTNAVKHFKFEPRGKRRIHQKPNAGEIKACRFWLDLELELVTPRVVVAMGATAVTGLLGRGGAISGLRGKPLVLPGGLPLWVTVHPSYLLRMPDREQAALERTRFEADFKAIRQFADSLAA